MSKYKEIFKLKKMLEDAKIPFDWEESFGYDEHTIEKMKQIAPDLIEHYHIMYPSRGNVVCSVIEGFGTFGGPNDLLEIMGLLTLEEEENDDVLGHLTAEEVFKRIQYHHRENNKEKEIAIMKKIKMVDEDTLEMKEMEVEEEIPTDEELDTFAEQLRSALNCEPDDFYQRYKDYKEAEAKFREVYDPFKERLIDMHKNTANLPKTIVIGGTKLVYVSPSTRSMIDSKKLKEEEPEIAKKFTKTTNVSATVRLEET